MENYDADTWYQKDPEFIIRRHISYDRTNDQLLIRCPKNVYSRSYYYWELPIEKLARPHSAKKAFEKIAARPWGSVQVRQAILKALEYVYAGNLAALHIHDDK